MQADGVRLDSTCKRTKSLPRHLIDCLIRFLGSVAVTVPSAYYLLQSGPRGTGHHDGEHAEKEGDVGDEGRDEEQEERAASQEEPSEAEPVSIFFLSENSKISCLWPDRGEGKSSSVAVKQTCADHD